MSIGDSDGGSKISKSLNTIAGEPKVSKADTKENRKIKDVVRRLDDSKYVRIKRQFIATVRRMVVGPRQFRLPNGRIVEDRRHIARGKIKEQNLNRPDLKKADAKKKIVIDPNFIKSQSAKGAYPSDKDLSLFFKKLIEVFEQGRDFVKPSAEGRSHFLEKTPKEWQQFFERLSNSAASKDRKVMVTEIKEFILRGLVEKGGKGVVISDMMLKNSIEKFIRFPVVAEILNKLKALSPGESFSKEMLNLKDNEFFYKALVSEPDAGFVPQEGPSQGIFGSERTENMMRAKLGQPLETELQKKVAILKKNKKAGLGFFKFLSDKDAEEEGNPHRFTGWRHDLERPSRSFPMSIRAVIYLALLIISLIGIMTIVMRFMRG